MVVVIELPQELAVRLQSVAESRSTSVENLLEKWLDEAETQTDTFEDLDEMVQSGQLSPAAADAIREIVEGNIPQFPLSPEERRKRIAAWIGSVDSDATDASMTIRETLKKIYADKK